MDSAPCALGTHLPAFFTSSAEARRRASTWVGTWGVARDSVRPAARDSLVGPSQRTWLWKRDDQLAKVERVVVLGVRGGLHRMLPGELNEAGKIDRRQAAVDASSVQAKWGAKRPDRT